MPQGGFMMWTLGNLLLGERSLSKKGIKQQSLQLQSLQSQSLQLQTAYQSLWIVTNVTGGKKKVESRAGSQLGGSQGQVEAR